MPELHAFVSVARSGCITAAADGLEMTQGGVSRSIRRLESRLGVILFLRGGRGVTLTEAGRQLFDRVEPSLRVLSDAMMEIDTQASPRSRLTVRSVSTLATRWLIPKLPEFNQQIPNVRVVLQPYAPDDDFLDTQTDCWIVPRPPKGNPWPRHVMATYRRGNTSCRSAIPISRPRSSSQKTFCAIRCFITWSNRTTGASGWRRRAACNPSRWIPASARSQASSTRWPTISASVSCHAACWTRT